MSSLGSEVMRLVCVGQRNGDVEDGLGLHISLASSFGYVQRIEYTRAITALASNLSSMIVDGLCLKLFERM